MKKRLTIQDRYLIETLLKRDYKLKDIARYVNAESSTISREIKNRRTHDKEGIECDKTKRFPFICYNCTLKYHCSKKKYYYSYNAAQKDYENKLKYSRIGIDMNPDEVEYWNDYFHDKIKNKNQPILHIFKNIEKEFPKSIQTFYKYVHKGYFYSINDEMLARSFSYKERKKKDENPKVFVPNSVKKNRMIEDFNKYIENNPNANIVEMDTVIGKFEDKNCIMTLFFREQKLMLMFLIKKYNTNEVIKVFRKLRKTLGDKTFKKMFEVILTDNGWEFSKPDEIEFDLETGEKLINVFYTDSYSSWQKGGIERNHEFIRYIIPKGITFDTLNKKSVVDIMNNINNVQRKSLDYRTPYYLFLNKYGNSISKKLHLQYISKEDVNLSYKLIK